MGTHLQKGRLKSATVNGIVVILVFLILFPFLWILISSFKPSVELFGKDAFRFYPQHPTFENYVQVFRDHPFGRYLLNSLIVATATTLWSIAVATFAAYAIAHMRFKGKALILGMILAISMFPQIVTISPIYIFLTKVGLTNSYIGLIIPYTTFALPMAVWLLVAFFRKIPPELFEAAKIDGSTTMQTYWYVLLPLATPGIFTTAILIFIAAWNEFLFALVINTNEAFKTVPVGISMFQGRYTTPWALISAVTVIVTLPLAAMVLLFQKQIVSGLTAGSMKG